MKAATVPAASRALCVFDIVEEFWPPEMFRKAHLQIDPAAGTCASPLFAEAVLGPGAARRMPELEQRLRREGFVGGRFHRHKTIDQQPKIGGQCIIAGPLENAHRAAACAIDLPIHQNMEPEDLEQMAGILAEVVRR